MDSKLIKRIFSILIACCLALPAQADDTLAANKTAVQSAFLLNFAMFTEWPSLPNDEFRICVLGDDSMLEALASAKNKQIKGRPVTIVKVHDHNQLNVCQILFVGQSKHALMKDIADHIGNSPVLVVSDENAYDPSEVTIVLGMQQDRIVFKVNRTASERQSLNFSSKLLKLAVSVY